VTTATPAISQRQNSKEMLAFLRAMSVSHARAQRLEGLRLWISALIAGLGSAATFVDTLATPAVVVGGLWAIAYSMGVGTWARREVRRAALLQEMFDVTLYKLPWNPVAAGEPLPPHEVSSLARRYHGPDELLYDYYEVPDLPRPYDVLACQQQNLGWGARIRQRYAFATASLLGIWCVAGIVVGTALGLHIADLVLTWYIPSLGVLLVGTDLYHGQQETASIRSKALKIIREEISRSVATPGSPDGLITLARRAQDVIFQTRQSYTRVPDWFFLRFRLRDRHDFQEAMTELTATLNRRR
jgi:hypothetical protein